MVNEHDGKVPRDHRLDRSDEEAIVTRDRGPLVATTSAS